MRVDAYSVQLFPSAEDSVVRDRTSGPNAVSTRSKESNRRGDPRLEFFRDLICGIVR